MVKLSLGPWAVAVQGVAVAGGIAALLLAPPASGAMLVVPISGSGTGALNAALAAGARVIGAGRLPGSVVVEGRRGAMIAGVTAAGGVILAASPRLCGGAERTA